MADTPDRSELRRRHEPYNQPGHAETRCIADDQVWPCDATVLEAALRRLVAAADDDPTRKWARFIEPLREARAALGGSDEPTR